MSPPDDSILSWLLDHAWLVIVGLVGVVWKQNEKIQASNEAALESHKRTSELALQEHKALNTKLHDDTHDELEAHRKHIARLFENAEADRKQWSIQLSEHRTDSFNRHIELMTAINAKADR